MRDRHPKLKVLDLYSGLGGLSLGFEFTGLFKTLGGIDNYAPAIETFYQNHPDIEVELLRKPQDLSSLEPSRVEEALGEKPDVIVGGPPCQGFSHAGRRLDDISHDKRNEQVFHFFRFVTQIRPKAFLMENVSGILRTGQSRKHELLDFLTARYQEIGYAVAWRLLDTVNYRVPQSRKRLILVGIRDSNRPFSFPEPPCRQDSSLFSPGEEFYTVKDALSDLPSPNEDEPQSYSKEPESLLQDFLRRGSTKLYNHLITKHSPQMEVKLELQKIGTRLYPNWNHSWYRLDPSAPSPAVKENHRAPFVHFKEPRSVSPRECARLQTIPDKYRLHGTKTAQLVMLGNAVPPIFSAHLATALATQAFDLDPPVRWALDSNPLVVKTPSRRQTKHEAELIQA